MPDLPPQKRRRPLKPDPVAGARDIPPYVELHVKTNFSFLEGASHPDELVQRAAELGYRALAVTDRNSLAGVVRAHVAARTAKLKLLIGAEITSVDAPDILLFATDRAAYGRLSALITHGRRCAPKGKCRLTFDDVAARAEGLLACVPLQCFLHNGDFEWLDRYRDLFGDRCYALAERHLGPNDHRLLEHMRLLAQDARLPLVAGNDVHYHVPQRHFLQDVLTAIRHGTTIAELGRRLFSNGERYLKSPRQMMGLFADCSSAVARTVEVADRCTFSLDELRYEYPEELCPPGMTALEHLTRLAWQGAHDRYPRGVPDKVRRLIEHELQLIEQLRYEAYFLTVWDLVRYARSRGILCQGRGSAANSAVCYCLGVTSVDPERIDVLFERFVSKERNEAPDIDVDFEHERREEVIQYVYEKYGRDRAGLAATVITYRHRSAVRDVGKALGLSLDRVDALAKSLEHYAEDEKLAARFREAGLPANSRVARQLIALVREIVGFPRHLSQHVGGMVITRDLLSELVPIENAAMSDRTVVEWDKDDLEALGILKVDCLALGMLTAIRKCFGLIERHHRRRLTLATVPPEDSAVYDMACRADTLGVFQIESRAQMAMLPRLRPRCFYDLVIEIAIVRPGPIQGDMVHPYLRRRCGEEKVEYPDERIRAVLEKTLGVPIFQEQAMQLAVVAAGFTPGEADQLRRAMGAWRRRGEIDRFRKMLIEGMAANGYSPEFAERVFKQIRGFGEYGFPESHSASFALLVYVSAWLKCYYPAAFAAALLNSQPMGFYAPAQLVADARKHGVEVRPVDVNHSNWDCTLESPPRGEGPQPKCRTDLEVRPTNAREQGPFNGKPEATGVGQRSRLRLAVKQQSASHSESTSAVALRLGLRMIRGLSLAHAERIERCRTQGQFRSFADFARRTDLSAAVLKQLSRADAFGSLALNRRQALWQSMPARETAPLFAAERDDPQVELPATTPFEDVVADYRTVGLSLRNHPVAFIRDELNRLGATPAAGLQTAKNGARLSVAGLVLLRQRPSTASGITFITLEDETGLANLIVRPEVWERHHHAARTAGVMLAAGELQRKDEVIHVLVHSLRDVKSLSAQVAARSRDFR